MIHKYSSSFKFRQTCKYCSSPPIINKYVGHFHLDDRDLIQINKDNISEHDFYIIPTSVIDDFLYYRESDKIRSGIVNYQIRDYKLSVSSQRKHKVNTVVIDNKPVTHFARCKCGKTSWFKSAINKDSFPELNRKA